MDQHSQENEHGTTALCTMIQCQWEGHKGTVLLHMLQLCLLPVLVYPATINWF